LKTIAAFAIAAGKEVTPYTLKRNAAFWANVWRLCGYHLSRGSVSVTVHCVDNRI